MPSVELQELLWHDVFSNFTQWWDDRRGKPASRHPGFRHKNSKAGLWLDSKQEPAWIALRPATWDARMNTPPESALTSGQGQGACGSLIAPGDVTDFGICRKLCEDGLITDAVEVLNNLVQRGCRVPNNCFYLVLKHCKNLVLGRRIHALALESGFDGDAFLATHLIGFYASYGRLEEAVQVFAKVRTPSLQNWATIIFAHAREGKAAEAIGLSRQMLRLSVQPNNRVYVAVLKACASAADLLAGKEFHAHILASQGNSDIFVQTGLVDMYAKCGSMEDARKVFDNMLQKDVVTWNAMIAGYNQNGAGDEALNLYTIMQQEGAVLPNSVTFLSLLQACANVGPEALRQGQQLHRQIKVCGHQHAVALGGSLVNMYAKCGSLEATRVAFDMLTKKDVVAWTAMMTAYTQQGIGQKALTLYRAMQKEGITLPNSVTFVCLLQACAGIGVEALYQGKQLHEQIEEQELQIDVVLGGSLVNMYAKCGSTEEARGVFDGLKEKDVVTWNAMIAGYAQQGMGQKALELYRSMSQEGIIPNSVTFVSLLEACALVAALASGKELYRQIMGRGLQGDIFVGASLVNMYAKCGSMFEAQEVFDSLPEKTVGAWSALIDGYSRQGNSEVVFDLLEKMRLAGLQPNTVTFISVLTACSHSGAVENGRQYFESMKRDYGISPTVEHYTCMMDLLGRAGYLDEALQMAKTMPFQPDVAVWLTLLGACWKWKNVGIGRQAFEFAVNIDNKNSAPYVVMSNIYACCKMVEEAKEMQARRVQFGAWKQPGQSWWTDTAGGVHTFVVGDNTSAFEDYQAEFAK